MSAATLLRDFAVIFGCLCSSMDPIAASRRVAFTSKTSGKSTSKTSLSLKQLRRHQPAPRRTTCASPLKELRAASSFESNQRVRTARSTPGISRAFLRQSFFIFS